MAIIPPLPYTLTNGQVADATQVMADLNAIMTNVNSNAQPIVGAGTGAQASGQCRLVYTNATTLTLVPYNGPNVQISGALLALPSGGVQITNSGLVANTLYYIYAFNSSGAVALVASTTAWVADTAAGNVGVAVMSGNNSRSLVGMVYTNATAQFQDAAGTRGVASWFNRRTRALYYAVSGVTINSATTSALSAAGINTLVWAEEADVIFNACGIMRTTSAAYATGYLDLWADGAGCNVAEPGMTMAAASGVAGTMAVMGVPALTEGNHFLQLAGRCDAGQSITFTQFGVAGYVRL